MPYRWSHIVKSARYQKINEDEKSRKIICVVLNVSFYTSCGQNQTNVPQYNIKSSRVEYSESQLKEAATSKVPMSMVPNVKQDRNGNILIASYLGVFRYDRTSFANITNRISSPSFRDVLEDRKGNLWFGASRYDGKSFRNFTSKDGFPSNSIRLLLEDKTGKLWFGAQGENMFVYDGKTFTVLKNKDGKAFNNVWLIIEDKKGNIWTTGSNASAGQFLKDSSGRPVWALSRYDHKSLYNKKPTVTEIMSGPPAFFGLLEANDGSIWFGSGRGVYRYDGKTITAFKSKEDQK